MDNLPKKDDSEQIPLQTFKPSLEDLPLEEIRDHIFHSVKPSVAKLVGDLTVASLRELGLQQA